MTAVSVVIRARNEEKWIRHCLDAVLSQTHSSFEVIVVDNSSQDKTVDIAKRFAGVTVIPMAEYTPGKALNEGVNKSQGEKIAFISAHCIPTDKSWLEKLEEAFSEADSVAGVYGRQWPMASSSPTTVSDLTNIFGPESRVQKKDPFFHNANSMIARSIWEDEHFDESAKNLEDRLWAQRVIDRGYSIVYEPSAGVFHHDGLHRDSDPERALGHVQVINGMDRGNIEIPASIRPESASVVPIITLLPRHVGIPNLEEMIGKTLEDLEELGPTTPKIVVGPGENFDLPQGAEFLSRDTLPIDESSSLEEVLEQVALRFEMTSEVPDFYLYVNLEYQSRPAGFFGQLIRTAREGAFDSVFGATGEFAHIWAEDSAGRLRNISPEIKSRSFSSPVYRAHYGMGTLVAASALRSGRVLGGSVGIVSLPEGMQTLRIRGEGFEVSRTSK
jgi:GT2 family glycosyltransferase